MRQRMKVQRLKQAWSDELTTGIFSKLQTKNVPWAALNIETSLNMVYHLNRSGNKIVSPLVESYTENIAELSEVEKTAIAESIYTIYGDKWGKLYELLSLEYNPIANYDMTEEETIQGETSTEATRRGTDTTTGTGTDTITHTGTEQNANTGTVTNQHTGTTATSTDETSSGSSDGTTDNKIYGFNSSNGVDDSSSVNETSATSNRDVEEQTTNNLTDTRTDATTATRTDNLTDTETRNVTDQTTYNTTDATTGENETTRTLTRSGNIGVTTTQQMIQSSIDLWQWNFFNQVFDDIDTILTISTY